MSSESELLQTGRVVVVTGGTAGVGRAAVRAFADNGDDVAILARGEEGLEATRAEAEGLGVRALAIPTDVADADQVEAAAERVERELGPIDVWVNNAMATVFARLVDIEPEEYRRATEVTYLGAVWGTMSALRRFLPRDRGVIVQVGSALAYRAIPLQAPYCGAKHAMRAMTDALRAELIHDGSRVHLTMVHLPGLNTPQFEWSEAKVPNHPQPVPPVYQPEIAAEAILWASQHRRREVTVGEPTARTILGQKIVPGYMDRYLAEHTVEGQQIEGRPVLPDRETNLFAPVPGDHGAHGIFDERSRDWSPWFVLSRHRGWIATGLATGVAALGVAVGLGRR